MDDVATVIPIVTMTIPQQDDHFGNWPDRHGAQHVERDVVVGRFVSWTVFRSCANVRAHHAAYMDRHTKPPG